MSKNVLSEVLAKLPSTPGVNQELEGLCEYLDSHLHELRTIYVFGSQARGDWHEESGVDLIVVIDEKSFLQNAPNKSLLRRVDSVILDYMYCHPVLHFIAPHCYLSDPIVNADLLMDEGENPFFLFNIQRSGVKIYDRKSNN